MISTFETGLEYYNLNDYPQAIKLFNKSLTEVTDTLTISNIYRQIGDCYNAQHDYITAYEYYLRSLDFHIDEEIYFNLGAINYLVFKDNKTALQYFKAALSLGFTELGIKDYIKDIEKQSNIIRKD